MRKKVIAANWKMNLSIKETEEFCKDLKDKELSQDVEKYIFSPYTMLKTLVEGLKETEVIPGAQNMHYEDKGAYTGEISAEMLNEIGIKSVILGHSERREHFGESDETVRKKLKKALSKDMTSIVCIGETKEERDQNKTQSKIKTQLEGALKDVDIKNSSKIILAYEPIWAIGTGESASPEDANEVITYIRSVLKEIVGEKAKEIRILYGGSVKPENIRSFMEQSDIDGALVGGASLKVDSFTKLINYRD